MNARGSVGPVSDEELLLRVAAGHAGAFEVLYARLRPRVLAVAMGALHDPLQAEEVAQEVMLEVWLKARRFDPARGSARTWVMTAARRRAIDRVRHSESARARDLYATTADPPVSADPVASEVEVRLAVEAARAALLRVTPRQREAIRLAYADGRSYREVARALGVPVGTAKSRIRDGLRKLRRDLEPRAA